MFFSTITSIVLLVSSVPVNAAGLATREPQFPACSGFEVMSNETRQLEVQNVAISTGVICNVNSSNFSTPCDVESWAWIEPGTVMLNANGSVATRSDYEIGYGIWNATGDPRIVYSSFIGAVENETVHFDNGTSGWVVFTPTYRCINGRIQGCPADFSLSNGTEISACYAALTDRVVSFESSPGHFENISVLAGERSINETSVQAAASLSRNPSNHPPYGLLSSGAEELLRTMGLIGALGMLILWVEFWAM